MSGGIIIFSETDQGAFELLTKGRELSKVLNMELLALTIGRKAENLKPYLEYGAQRVLLIPHDEVLDTDTYTQMLYEVAKDDGPDIVLIRSTRAGKELAGRVAQKLQAGCVTDALNLTAKNSDLVVDRYALGGNTPAAGGGLGNRPAEEGWGSAAGTDAPVPALCPPVRRAG